ncbi:carbohydrate esterase family 3 protein [Annulohypoxylon bovei var. microspora]|nr:carbohydrate esterase family 3 protein [Annulohypoxylon bovei var. microspora]
MLATKHLLWCMLACASQVANGLALPKPEALGGIEALWRDTHHARAKGFGNGMPLRIMPLGASITYGFGSTDANGYREDLRAQLETDGNKVNMVGSNPSGKMEDNDTEGWKGYTIDQVHGKADASVPKDKPNLILINVGTNDAVLNKDLPNAGKRMTNLLNDLYKDSPRATVILSTLLVNGKASVQSRVLDINAQYKTVASQFQASKHRLVLVDMQGDAGPKVADLNKDGTHPTNAGYKKMATVWLAGIKEADQRHFLQTAEKVPGIPDDGA